MIIVSQDKKVHMPYELNRTYIMQSKLYDMKYLIVCDDYDVAKYSTEEKALKVMNEIKNHYTSRDSVEIKGIRLLLLKIGLIEPRIYNLNSSYQMPLDEEVEV